MAKIRSVVVEGNRETGFKRVQVLFGTNCFLEIVDENGRIHFSMGAHHSGFKADASEIDSELQQYIGEIQERHPDHALEHG